MIFFPTDLGYSLVKNKPLLTGTKQPAPTSKAGRSAGRVGWRGRREGVLQCG